ncbi:hypothetical protein EVAR_4018_1 [Eumeta japonica]|uniref:Uncharacterized protein n=1 Tax=Eumeta variegata TaxID=151549 RepID=A0A4C1T4K5_EUMVA|nr:hypothetical protein EVAR_4018_1 [Eumeta japonica]
MSLCSKKIPVIPLFGDFTKLLVRHQRSSSASRPMTCEWIQIRYPEPNSVATTCPLDHCRCGDMAAV